MNILGISCFYHDVAAALLQGRRDSSPPPKRSGSPGIKHDFGFPENGHSPLSERRPGSRARDLDYVVFYEKPFRKFERILMTSFQGYPALLADVRRGDDHLVRRQAVDEDHHQGEARARGREDPLRGPPPLARGQRFLSLALRGGRDPDGRRRGGVDDGRHGTAKGNDITLVNEIRFPHSLGLLYSAFTAFLGFEVNEGEYKVMGMAPYGKPRYVDKVWTSSSVAAGRSVPARHGLLLLPLLGRGDLQRQVRGPVRGAADPKMHFFTSADEIPILFRREAGRLRRDVRPETEHYADIAASIQRVTEEIILRWPRTRHAQTGLTKLCMAGGVRLNSVANGRILNETPFEDLFIQPAAGDSGGALGAALYAYHGCWASRGISSWSTPIWGKATAKARSSHFLDGQNIPYAALRRRRQAPRPGRGGLAAGKVVGLVPGPVRVGPAGARQPEHPGRPASDMMKDMVNIKIKFREPFRPVRAGHPGGARG